MGVFSNVFKGTNGQNEMVADMQTYTTSGMVAEGGQTSNSVGNSATSITEDTALSIPALNQGINIISDTIASMPVSLYREKDGFQEKLVEDSRSRALTDMANETLTSYNLKKNLIKDLILYGNAYAKIVREGDSTKLIYLPKNIVTPKKDSNGYFFSIQSYTTDITGESMPSEIVDYGDMLCLIRNPQYNSITGKGLLDFATDVFDMSIQESNYMINLFKNGLSAKAILSSKTPFKKEVKEQLKQDLRNLYSSANNSGKILVLEGDVSVAPLALSPTDVKLIENKNFTITEISRFLNIPKHMLNLDRGQGTYSNITQERMQLLINTLTPYVTAIEGALNQKLLTEEEQKAGYYFQFDTSEMMKLTPEDNADHLLKLYNANVITLEEVRTALNLGGNVEIIQQLKEYDKLKFLLVKQQLQATGNLDDSMIADNKTTDEKLEKEEKAEDPSATPKKEEDEKDSKESE